MKRLPTLRFPWAWIMALFAPAFFSPVFAAQPASYFQSAPAVNVSATGPLAGRPDYGFRLPLRFSASGPFERDYGVFVHFIDKAGRMAFQADHAPPVATSKWSGEVRYAHTVALAGDTPQGEYRVVLGLYDAKGRAPLVAGEGVTEEKGDDGKPARVYQVGVLTVSADAPIPELGKPTLDLTGYRTTFVEEFDKPLDVSAWGPGTRWIAHTPYGGDFGDAGFADPGPRGAFTVADGKLTIEARKEAGKWKAGLLCSVDPKGNGFSQKYGYFEMRAKLPKGPGTWPAFWLNGVERLKGKRVDTVEIDVLEQYGAYPNVLHSTVHRWHGDGKHEAEADHFIVPGMTDDFHRYGTLVTPDRITVYFDGIELWHAPTPPEAKVPLYILVDLALGGGWPIDKTPDPSRMVVDYVKAYHKDGEIK